MDEAQPVSESRRSSCRPETNRTVGGAAHSRHSDDAAFDIAMGRTGPQTPCHIGRNSRHPVTRQRPAVWRCHPPRSCRCTGGVRARSVPARSHRPPAE
ncbi:D-Ala-D-Ala carboxypeptidase family metallohydrolase [Maliponia aquimaris]|uniref:D-Ala-D-Ala carboxypeptidase family metallohydrolase n=1 Tax=Maliponia aquimaris TaxID=1673631 RepID=UPI000B8B0CEA|nr:D-Ala-D-Ala carboxypeptidase family metallohydrolase [Maliponia aquimaris]